MRNIRHVAWWWAVLGGERPVGGAAGIWHMMWKQPLVRTAAQLVQRLT